MRCGKTLSIMGSTLENAHSTARPLFSWLYSEIVKCMRVLGFFYRRIDGGCRLQYHLLEVHLFDGVSAS